MISYDILQNLENNCFELLNATTGMISGSNEKSMGKSHQNIVRALRKIVIANEMMGKGIICISGLQGAGKSTLMKNFYGLSDEYFNIKTGVGKKIPVFICENGECKGPEMYAMTLEKQDAGTYIRKNVKMNAEDFRNASSGEETNLNIMYLELRVPYKHLNNESYAFMLLPGFEKKNDYWRSLIDFSVKCSDTSIFVFNESSFSKYDNQVLLDKIHERFGESLIYAISQSDLSEDNNATVKNTCIDVMKISKGEEDRVICVGEYENETDNERWIVELKRAIEKYCNSIETARKNCTQYIYEIIEDELRPELSAIKDALGSDTGDMLESHLENSSYLKAFDQVVKDRRKKIETKLDSTLDKSFISSRDRLEKIFSDSSYAKELGVKDERIIRRTVFGENVKDIKRARARVEAALKRENGVYDFQYAFFDAITETSLEAVDDNECRHILLEDQQSELSVFEESVDIVLSEESIAKRQNILFDVAALLSKTNNMPQPKHNNPAETMKVIAELGAEHFGLATLNKSSEENSSLIIPETINEKLQVGYKEIAEKVTNVDKVVLGTLGITGVDILADGVLDAIPTIAAGLGISVPIVAATAGLIMAGTSSVAIVQDINRLKRTELSSAQNAIIAIQSQIKTKYLESYDEAMQAIRDRIEENLIAATGVNKQIFKKTSAMIAISKIDNDLDIICREVTRKAYDIGEVFR